MLLFGLEEGHIQMNKVAHNNLRVKLGNLINMHQCFGMHVHILLFDDSIEGLSGNIFNIYMKPYLLNGKSLFVCMKNFQYR
jgi:transitional endoplasmic reticulum ATPase